jgi:type IV pilus biogenesis protein CpaD/CtpE
MRTVIAALTTALLSGCVSQQSVDAERRFKETIPTCVAEKECELKWSAARRWLLDNSTMKLQHYTADLMETFNPVQEGIGGRVIKEPVDAESYRIVVDVWCGGFSCFGSMTKLKQSFNDYVAGTAR